MAGQVVYLRRSAGHSRRIHDTMITGRLGGPEARRPPGTEEAPRRPLPGGMTAPLRRAAGQDSALRPLFPAEMHEKSAVILGVFLDPVIQGFDLFLIEEPEDPLL